MFDFDCVCREGCEIYLRGKRIHLGDGWVCYVCYVCHDPSLGMPLFTDVDRTSKFWLGCQLWVCMGRLLASRTKLRVNGCNRQESFW